MNKRKEEVVVEEKTVEKVLEETKAKRKEFMISMVFTLCFALVVAFVFNNFFGLTKVAGISMNPTFKDGQFLFFKKYGFEDIKVNDIITFNGKNNNDTYVKRVVACGGDTVCIDGLDLYVNGEIVEEPYVAEYSIETYTGNLTVPTGCYFVLGDNRDNSLDSREFGVVSSDQITGVVLFQ